MNLSSPAAALPPVRQPASRSLLARARALGPARLALLPRAFILLLAARLALAFIPVRFLVAWGQRPVRSRGSAHPAADAAAIRHAILTVAGRSPLRFVCFPQCLAAAALLRARGIPSRLHYGVARAPGGALITHTWLEAAGRIVIGGEAAPAYSTLAVF